MLVAALQIAVAFGSGACALGSSIVDPGVAELRTRAFERLFDDFWRQRFSLRVQPDPDDDADPELDVVQPPAPPPPPRKFLFRFHDSDLPRFSETGKNVPAVEVLHRIAQAADWSLLLVGVGRERIDVDIRDADPRAALRDVLQASGSMGVLRRDRLVVVPASERRMAGVLVEQRTHRRQQGPERRRAGRDMVKIFQGDLVVPQGTAVNGDVVNVGGSIEIEPGSVVQGDVVSVAGSTVVDQGAVVLGSAIAVLGKLEVQRGAQVMGEQVQAGLGGLVSGLFGPRQRESWFSHLGPLGFFPTVALFVVIYLLGLIALRLWPERVRGVGEALTGAPLKSFFVGLLCWLLLVPSIVLLVVSVVGIPLVPLLPIAIFLGTALGICALALRLGELLPAGPGQRFVPPAAMGMGVLAFLLLGLLPWLGLPLLALLQFFALGAAVGSRFGRTTPPPVRTA